jgi:hypothetical protein
MTTTRKARRTQPVRYRCTECGRTQSGDDTLRWCVDCRGELRAVQPITRAQVAEVENATREQLMRGLFGGEHGRG